ncbi:MAG TPA: LysM peptidoglycan-binding domain-containing protein, partial [Opitutaceae bacterium]|nr:LysM peptidoglycan-binding domain-containing protein [Opitutaceae bacterium]
TARVSARAPAQERDALRGQLEELGTRFTDAERRVAQLKQTADAAKAENEKARTDILALQGRLTEVQRAAEERGAAVAEMSGVNEKLANEKSVLERQVAQWRQAADQSRSEVGELKDRMSLTDRQAEDQASKLGALTAVNEKLQAQVRDLSGQLAGLRDENSRHVASSATEVGALKSKLAEAEQAAQRQAASIADLTRLNEKLGGDKTTLERTIAQAQQAADVARTEIADLRNQLTAASRTAQEQAASNNTLFATNEKLQAQLKDSTDQLGAMRAENARLAVASEGAAALNTELAATKSRLTDLQAAAQKQATSLGELTGVNEKLGSEKIALERQVTQLRQAADVTRLEVAELRTRLAATDRTTQEQLAANHTLTAANTKLQAEVADAAAQINGFRAENARLAVVSEGAAALRTELANAQSKLADLQSAAEKQTASLTDLTGVSERLGNEKSALERQLADARQTSEAARTESADLKTRLAAMERAAQEQLVAATASAAALRTELAEAKTKLADIERTAEQQTGSVAELTVTKEKLTNELRDLQAQLGALRTENTRLAQSDQARQEAEQRAAGLAAAAAQAATLQRDLLTARGEVARLTENVQMLERDRATRVSQLQQENAAVSARLRQAQGTLDQIASAARLINGNAPGFASNTSTTPTVSVPNATVTFTPTLPLASTALPPPAPSQPQSRVHVVAEGDSLTRISSRYYGTSSHWQDIYEANAEILRGENALRPGQRLRIP